MNIDQRAVLAGIVIGLGLIGGAVASITYYIGHYVSSLIPWAAVPTPIVHFAASPIFHLTAIGFIASLFVLTILYIHAIYTK